MSPWTNHLTPLGPSFLRRAELTVIHVKANSECRRPEQIGVILTTAFKQEDKAVVLSFQHLQQSRDILLPIPWVSQRNVGEG